eukprot:SAG11_NODE_16941_length_533_cov_0.824885_2_plen_91_part_01
MNKAERLNSNPQDEELSSLEDTDQNPWDEDSRSAEERILKASSNQNNGVNGTLLILSPMRDRSHALARFFRLMSTLDYPKHLISIGILEGA